LDPLQKFLIKHQPGAANLLGREAVNILKDILQVYVSEINKLGFLAVIKEFTALS